jgi:hypothetical protein
MTTPNELVPSSFMKCRNNDGVNRFVTGGLFHEGTDLFLGAKKFVLSLSIAFIETPKFELVIDSFCYVLLNTFSVVIIIRLCIGADECNHGELGLKKFARALAPAG